MRKLAAALIGVASLAAMLTFNPGRASAALNTTNLGNLLILNSLFNNPYMFGTYPYGYYPYTYPYGTGGASGWAYPMFIYRYPAYGNNNLGQLFLWDQLFNNGRFFR